MANALAYGSRDRVPALAGDIVLCSWARHSLSAQVYKRELANLIGGGGELIS